VWFDIVILTEVRPIVNFYNPVVSLRKARFNIHKFHVLPHTVYLCVLCGSQKKTAIISLYNIN